jgi:hypothetical protein
MFDGGAPATSAAHDSRSRPLRARALRVCRAAFARADLGRRFVFSRRDTSRLSLSNTTSGSIDSAARRGSAEQRAGQAVGSVDGSIAFTAVNNGLQACAGPQRLQAICDELSADKIDALLRKWLRRLPHPFTADDRRAGYRYDISILQAQFALTQVLDKPAHGRLLFEQIIRYKPDARSGGAAAAGSAAQAVRPASR